MCLTKFNTVSNNNDDYEDIDLKKKISASVINFPNIINIDGIELPKLDLYFRRVDSRKQNRILVGECFTYKGLKDWFYLYDDKIVIYLYSECNLKDLLLLKYFLDLQRFKNISFEDLNLNNIHSLMFCDPEYNENLFNEKLIKKINFKLVRNFEDVYWNY